MRGIQLTTTQLLLITALCALVVGAVTAANRESYDAGYYHLTYSADGRYLIGTYSSRSYRSRIRKSEIHVWDLSQTPPLKKKVMMTNDLGKTWNTFHGQQSLYTVDASTIALATTSIENDDSPGQLILWDFVRDEHVKSCPLPTRMPRYGRVSFAPAAMLVAAIDDNDTSRVVILNIETGEEVIAITTPDTTWWIGLSADGTTLLTSERPAKTDKTTVRVWDVVSGLEVRQFSIQGRTDKVSFNDKQMSFSTYEQIETWNLISGEKTNFLEDPETLPYHVSMPTPGSRLAVARTNRINDRIYSIIDTATCQSVGTLSSQDSALQCHAETVDCRQLAIAFGDEVSLFDLTSQKFTETLWKESHYASFIGAVFVIGFVLWGIVWRLTSPVRQVVIKRKSPPRCFIDTAIGDRIGGAILVILLASVLTFALSSILQNWLAVFFAWPLFVLIVIAAIWIDLSFRAYRRRTWRNAWQATLKAIGNAQNIELQTTPAGVVTAAFFKGSQLDSVFDWEWTDVQRRFKELVGRSIAIRDPLLILVFQQQDALEYQLGGELAGADMFNAIERRAHRIVISEEGLLDRLTSPERSLRFWLSTFIGEQALQRNAPPWLASAISSRLGNHEDQHAFQTSLRRLKVSNLENSEYVSTKEVKTAINTSWQSYWARAQKGKLGFDVSKETRSLTPVESFRESVRLKDDWTVFAAFLADGTGTGGARLDPLIHKLLGEKTRRKSVNQILKFKLEGLVDQFVAWFDDQVPRQYADPPERIAMHLNGELALRLFDESLPNYERIERVRSLGLSGYAAAVNPLNQLLCEVESKSRSTELSQIQRNELHEMQNELQWALGNIMGKGYSTADQVGKWMRSHQLASDKRRVEIIPAPESLLSVDGDPPKKIVVPKELKRCLLLLFVAGVTTIIWSTFVLFTNNESTIVWMQAIAIMIGCSAVAVSGSSNQGAVGTVCATLVLSMFFTCNFPAFVLAIFATSDLSHINVDRYFKSRAGLPTIEAAGGQAGN